MSGKSRCYTVVGTDDWSFLWGGCPKAIAQDIVIHTGLNSKINGKLNLVTINTHSAFVPVFEHVFLLSKITITVTESHRLVIPFQKMIIITSTV